MSGLQRVWAGGSVLAALVLSSSCRTLSYPADPDNSMRRVAVMRPKIYSRRCPYGWAVRRMLERRLMRLNYDVLASKRTDVRLRRFKDSWAISPSSAAAILEVDGVVYPVIDACDSSYRLLTIERRYAMRLALFDAVSPTPVWTNGVGVRSVERIGTTVVGDIMADVALAKGIADEPTDYGERGPVWLRDVPIKWIQWDKGKKNDGGHGGGVQGGLQTAFDGLVDLSLGRGVRAVAGLELQRETALATDVLLARGPLVESDSYLMPEVRGPLCRQTGFPLGPVARGDGLFLKNLRAWCGTDFPKTVELARDWVGDWSGELGFGRHRSRLARLVLDDPEKGTFAFAPSRCSIGLRFYRFTDDGATWFLDASGEGQACPDNGRLTCELAGRASMRCDFLSDVDGEAASGVLHRSAAAKRP